MPGSKLKGICIGAGFFAEFQADAWQRMDSVEITAVCDPVPGKAEEFAEKFNIPRAYESVEVMLAEEKTDFVDIVTRPDTHLELTQLAASRGLHVICQKPMAPVMTDCMAMCDACERAGVRLLVHENWRWQPWYREAKRLINGDELGNIKHLSFDWRTGDGNGPDPFTAQPYFCEMPRFLIHESLVHILDTFRFLSGELRIVSCETRRVNPVIAGEDWAEIRVVFANNGTTGFIHGDRQTGPMPAPVAMGQMIIEGTRATLRISADGHMFLTQTGTAETQLSFTPNPTGYKGDSVFATQQHLLECLRNNNPCESEGREYLKTVALVESAYTFSPTPKKL